MATVTGLTADRMLAIEAASVVDGDVDASGNLILTQKGGTQINAGSVIGPPGPQGPVGSMLSVITAQPVLDVGVINQIRAGRQLSPADFGAMGLSAPLGLWNLSDLSDASGNGRALSNKGAVPFASGINGIANTAAQFSGSIAQAFYIPDTGVNDPFRIKTGSWGAWFKTAKLSTPQALIEKMGASSNYAYMIEIGATNFVSGLISFDGSAVFSVSSASIICDDRWHFCVATYDGNAFKLYVDSILESVVYLSGVLFASPAPLNIGARAADGSTAGNLPNFGRIDETFVTADVLHEDQIRNLYCAKIPHTLAATPARFTTNVRRRRRGAALTAADFPTQPLRLHNFSAGSLGDEGSNAVALTSNPGTGTIVSVAGVDGSLSNSYNFAGAGHHGLSATDAGLPAALASRSYGCWFKTTTVIAQIMLAYAGNVEYLAVGSVTPGFIAAISGGDTLNGGYVSDGAWHFVVIVEDNGEIAGVKHKLYVDGKLQSSSATLNAATLAGAVSFRVGADSNGNNPFIGQVDSAFVCNYALTSEQIIVLYAKSLLTLSPSPKNPGDHIEGADANNLFAIFDTLDSNFQVDLKVAS